MRIIRSLNNINIFFLLIFLPLFSIGQIQKEWSLSASNPSWEVCKDMAKDTSGNIISIGSFQSETGFEENRLQLRGDKSSYVLKFDKSGNIIWSKLLSSSEECYVSALSISEKNNIYIFGRMSGVLTGDRVKLDAKGEFISFLASIDSTGKINWIKKVEFDFLPSTLLVSADMDENLYIVGTTNEFDQDKMPATSKKNSENTYLRLLKYNSEGYFLKSKIIRSTKSIVASDLLIENSNIIALTGYFSGIISKSSLRLESQGQNDAYCILLDKELNIIQAHSLGSFYDDYGLELSSDTYGNIYWGGGFNGDLNLLDKAGISSNGLLDIFIVRINNFGEIDWYDTFGGQGNDYLHSLMINKQNRLYVYGSSKSEIKKEDYVLEANSQISFIAKYDLSKDPKFSHIETVPQGFAKLNGKILEIESNTILVSGNSNIPEIAINDQDSLLCKSHRIEDFAMDVFYDCNGLEQIRLPDDTLVCGDLFSFMVDSNRIYEQYFWNGIAGENYFSADTSGWVIVEARSSHNCISRDTCYVEFEKVPEFNFEDTLFVSNTSLLHLKGPEGMHGYKWSTSEVTPDIELNTKYLSTGEHEINLAVTTNNGCLYIDQITIIVGNYIENNILADLTENDSEFIFSMFPNPVREVTTLTGEGFDDQHPTSVAIISGKGELLIEYELSSLGGAIEKQLLIGHISSGVYFIRITNDTRTAYQKLIKQ
ncbi:MAG: T9SS type A sorting domain-containing protein [Bacteroidetes bacterium]|jgi:hypothetical protein|nr:T9SS type A sorting domain-containing protein [Bacteroidota bacterium]